MGIVKIMENVRYTNYEKALKRVKQIKGFYNHLMIYIIFNIILIAIKWKSVLFVLNETKIEDEGFINWMYIDILSTPIIWGIAVIIHGLYVFKFNSTFRGWEERKIKELMQDNSSIESSKWE